MEHKKAIQPANKIFLGINAALLVLSLGVVASIQFVLVPDLESRLINRGERIAGTIAARSIRPILNNKTDAVAGWIMETVDKGNKEDSGIVYIHVEDADRNVFAHTFTDAFPDSLYGVNGVGPEERRRVERVLLKNEPVFDVAVPVREGIYQVGTVHVGMAPRSLNRITRNLRPALVSALVLSMIAGFFISRRLASAIGKPVKTLIHLADGMARENFKPDPDFREPDLSHGSMEIQQLGNAIHNISATIQAHQNKLNDVQNQYRSLFDSVPESIFMLDPDTLAILDANAGAGNKYGYDTSEFKNTPFTDLYPPELRDTARNRLRAVCTDEPGALFQKVRHVGKSGKPFFVNIHARPIRFAGGDALMVSTTDITEMMEKESRLIQGSKMKTLGEMAAGIAHELNQPLNAIKMGSEFLSMMLERKMPIPDDQLDHVSREISTQTDRAAKIIRTLRAFGRKKDFSREKVDINTPIKSVFHIAAKQLNLENIDIRLDLDDSLPLILAGTNRLEQVFFNLVNNAKDAIIQKKREEGEGEAGLIQIRSFDQDGLVAVTVADNGGGVPEDIIDNIFEPFFTTKDTGHDMGLGLAIVYGIIRDYGGAIFVENHEDRGAVFTITFPAQTERGKND